MSEHVPAGWYPDGQGRQRYWDGAEWTSQLHDTGTRDTRGDESGQKKGAFSKLGAAVKKAASDRQATKEQLAREHAADVAAAGKLVTSGVFGSSTIELYEGGYVRIAKGSEDHSQPAVLKKTSPYERLSSISYTESEAERAAAEPTVPSVLAGTLGTAVTGILSGGKTLMKGTVPGLAVAGVTHLATTGSRRAILTVVTDRSIYTLSNQYKNSLGLKTSNKGHSEVAKALQAAGDAILGVQVVSTDSPIDAPEAIPVRTVAPGPTLAERLRELSMLHDEGILSDEEFASSKAKLLTQL